MLVYQEGTQEIHVCGCWKPQNGFLRLVASHDATAQAIGPFLAAGLEGKHR